MPNVTVETSAHGTPRATPRMPARNSRRSVDTRATPHTVTIVPTRATEPGRSPRKTTASSTPTTAYAEPIGDTTATGPSSSAR
jgi:hypothetical protein